VGSSDGHSQQYGDRSHANHAEDGTYDEFDLSQRLGIRVERRQHRCQEHEAEDGSAGEHYSMNYCRSPTGPITRSMGHRENANKRHDRNRPTQHSPFRRHHITERYGPNYRSPHGHDDLREVCVSGSWLVREISVFNILRHGSYFIKLLTSGPHPLARSDSVTAKQWSNSAKCFLCWRPANIPILPGTDQSFHIDRRMFLQRQATGTQETVDL
jgi:hypothetical protein